MDDSLLNNTPPSSPPSPAPTQGDDPTVTDKKPEEKEAKPGSAGMSIDEILSQLSKVDEKPIEPTSNADTPSEPVVEPKAPEVTPKLPPLPPTPEPITPPVVNAGSGGDIPPLTPEVPKEEGEIKKPPSKFIRGVKKNGLKVAGGMMMLAILVGGGLYGIGGLRIRKVTMSEAMKDAYGNHIGWTCFPAGTDVLMEDGSSKDIEIVKVGDEVISQSESGDRKVSKVTRLDQPIRDEMCKISFTNGESLEVTDEHPLFTQDGWKSMDPNKSKDDTPNLLVTKLKTGDVIARVDGVRSEVESYSCWSERQQAYNLILDGDMNTYFANGYLAHNKKDVYTAAWNAAQYGGYNYEDGPPAGGLPTNAEGNPTDTSRNSEINKEKGDCTANTFGCVAGKGATQEQWRSGIEIPGTYLYEGKRYIIGTEATMFAATDFAAANPNVVEGGVYDPSDASDRSGSGSIELAPFILCTGVNGYNTRNCDGDNKGERYYLTPADVQLYRSQGKTWAPPGTGCRDAVHDQIDCNEWHWTHCIGGGADGYGCGTFVKKEGGGEEFVPTSSYSCVDLSDATSDVTIGDTVAFNCVGSFTNIAAPVAYFRYNVDGGTYTESASVPIDLTSNSASYDVGIDQTGDWSVQCRVCTDNTAASCTAWGQAQ